MLDALGDTDGDFIKRPACHAPTMDENNRYICHFPEDNTIWSVNSGYGGNVLLGKKCFALRIASYLGRNEGWMAEHMLILGLENPEGEIKYIAAAFPSACGKTNLAMLIPPELYSKKGYKVWCVGDDIAWMQQVGPDGRLWAVNPENGFFGVAPGTNAKSNPNALASTQKPTPSSPTSYTTWTTTPSGGRAWTRIRRSTHSTGRASRGTARPAPKRARIPTPASPLLRSNCPCISKEFDNPAGVPISAIIFGGRRAKTAPLVYQSFDWKHGAFVGSIMASETTAAATGAVGVVRRDPMAMLPFCGYNMGEYFAHWLKMGETTRQRCPRSSTSTGSVSTDEGHFMWPGFGDNFRVLEWIIKRCEGKVDAKETAIGYVPYADDINLEELDYEIEPGRKFTKADLESILTVEKDYWLEDFNSVKEFYAKIGDTIPAELTKQLNDEIERLSK